MESRRETRLSTGLGKRPPSPTRVSHISHSLCYWKHSRRQNQHQTPHPATVYNVATSVLQFKLEPAPLAVFTDSIVKIRELRLRALSMWTLLVNAGQRSYYVQGRISF